MMVNIVLLTTYTFSCHSLRHLIGGKTRLLFLPAWAGRGRSAWRGVTDTHEHHMSGPG